MARDMRQWGRLLVACGCSIETASRWGPVLADVIRDGTFSKGDADIADWLPEILHESSMLTAMVENLNYSSSALVPLFGGTRITPAQATEFGRNAQHPANQRALANILYGGAWGKRNLGNNEADDGWTFRGRSPVGITGRGNYARVGALIGQDLISQPSLLEQPAVALEACVAWWENLIPDSMLGETTSIRRRVNGGSNGLADVQRLTLLVKGALNVGTS